jgi:hypothetical protein
VAEKLRVFTTIVLVVTGAVIVARLVLFKPAASSNPSANISTVLSGAITELRKTPKLVVLTVAVTAHVEKSSKKRLWFVDLGTTSVWVKAPGKVQYVVPLDGIRADWFRLKDDSLILRLPEPQVDREMAHIDPAGTEILKQIGWGRTNQFSGQYLEREARKAIVQQLIEAGESALLQEKSRVEARVLIHNIVAPVLVALDQHLTLEIDFGP